MLIRIGTRRSKLALAQTGIVMDAIRKIDPSARFEVHEIMTTGDRLYDQNLALIGGKGLFLKEIEEQMLANKIDIAVHSMKDVPAFLPDDLLIETMLEREDVRDAFICNKYNCIEDLPDSAVVGTSSPRRKVQLLALKPNIKVINFRGNVNTRLDKLLKGECDAIVLAYAGLKRLHMHDQVKQIIEPEIMLPAVGQGAIGIECRQDDMKIRTLLQLLNHRQTYISVTCERSFMKNLSGDCSTPIPAYAKVNGDSITLRVGYAKTTESLMSYENGSSDIGNAEFLGKQLALKYLV